MLEKAQICSTNSAGLGNRLKSYWSARRIDPHACLLWPTNTVGGVHPAHGRASVESFGELFVEDRSVKRCENHHISINGWRLLAMPEDGTHAIDYNYNDTPRKARDAYLPIVNSMVPTQAVKDIMESIGICPSVGIFYRSRTDTNPVSNVPSWDKWMRVIQSLKPCFVATDCPHMKQAIGSESRVSFVNRDMSKMYVGDWKYALAEMMLLGNCEDMVLLNDRYSTFAECAWWFGKCKANVSVVRDFNTSFSLRKQIKAL